VLPVLDYGLPHHNTAQDHVENENSNQRQKLDCWVVKTTHCKEEKQIAPVVAKKHQGERFVVLVHIE
jgi:hypothetical protein